MGKSSITSFESLKVQALFAYLLAQPGRTFNRPYLAALLWPDRPEDSARRNLRQAVYNLKTVFGRHGLDVAPIATQGAELTLHPDLDVRTDVAEFLAARRRGTRDDAVVHHDLAAAVALYRGDFLSGFAVKDSPDFEHWQRAERERLRDQAVDCLRVLIESYLSRGEIRLGLQYARRLTDIDPLSELAHQFLMRLYSLSGRRRRALAEYERLRELLDRELGVEPREETRQLYELIRNESGPEEVEDPAHEERQLGIGPLIPLVGRQRSYETLRQHWRAVLQGECRLSLVEGEAGIGKTRLVRSFLDDVGSRQPTTILKGRCYEGTPTPYQPFDQVLRNALSESPELAQRTLESMSTNAVTHLACLVPEARQSLPDLPLLDSAAPMDRQELFAAIAVYLEGMSNEAGGAPSILMLGDLQSALPETVALIEYLLEHLAASPIWLLGTSRTVDQHGNTPPVLALCDGSSRQAAGVHLDRLDKEAVEQLALALVGDHQAGELSRLLSDVSSGLPLAIAECINFLWDERILTHEAGRWHLRGAPAASTRDLDAMVRQRVRRLPASTRRLAAQAAVIGQHFDARILTEAANEHPRVVEVGLELMLERWLVRQHSDHWTSGRRERDLVLFARGARLGSFEFSHRIIGEAMLEDIHPRRRRILHREITQALEKDGEESDAPHEILGFHYREAGLPERASRHFYQAARQALSVAARDTAAFYLQQVIELAESLISEADDGADSARYRRLRDEAHAMLSALA